MDIERALILEWESKMRTNDEKGLPNSFFSFDAVQNEKNAIALFRYVFENVLHWTPEDVKNNISIEIINKLKLKKAYRKIIFPRELSLRSDCFYLAKKCYPSQIKGYNQEDIWRMEYMKILESDYGKFPKNYFAESTGELRARSFLMYQLETKVRFESKEAMYNFFANKKKATAFLDSVKLKTPLSLLYESPLEYLHCSLPQSQKDNLLFQYAQFQQLDKEQKEKEQ